MTFWGVSVWVGYGSIRIDFGSINFLSNTLIMPNTSNFVENFGSSMILFGSIRILVLLSGEYILDIGTGIGPD